MIVFSMFILVLAGSVYSADDAFVKADKNKDGNIDKKEFDAAVTEKFKQYDKNKDGVIGKEEFNAHKDTKAASEFEFMDRDRNGKINIDQFKAAAYNRYRLFDENKNNLLSNPEYRSDEGFPILKLYF